MFVRIKTTPNSPRKSVQIVNSVRNGDKVNQKIIRYVGIAMNDDELKKLKNLAESIKIKLEADCQELLFSPEELVKMQSNVNNKKNQKKELADNYKVNLKNLKEEQRTISGIHDIYGSLFDQLGYKQVFKNPARAVSTIDIFKNIVLARIANPLSKKASVDMLEEDFGITIPLNKVYKMMDKLDAAAIEKICDLTYQNTAELYNQKLDVMFFDATTVYFESFEEDELRSNGYSKDLKFNQPQVVLSLLVTKEGLPVAYQIFPGKTYEGHTLIPILKELKEKYKIDKVVFVADSGMFNADNLAELEINNFEYIVGARIKNMSKNITKKILDIGNYKTIDYKATDENKNSYKILRLTLENNRELIVSYSAKRARKDEADRDKAIKKLKLKLEKNKSQKEYLSNMGYKKYLKISGKSTIELNEEKIKEDSKWDGLKGIITNAKDLSNNDILEQYNNLWAVENAFRITKHDLKVRPVFHWAERRVRAHFAISFVAYAITRNLEYRIKLQYRNMSPEKIRQTLMRVQTSILFDTKKKIRYAFPSRISQDAHKIYNLMKINALRTPKIIG